MKLKHKTFKGVEVADEGNFEAVFATFDVIDRDNDVTVKGAFTKDQEVRISYWGHRWGDLPVGKGVIDFDDTDVRIKGRFFLDTEAGLETYKTVKNLGSLQEWSYGFETLEQEPGKFDGKDVNYLKKLDVFEVSPVMKGAGIGTRTESIKEEKDALACMAEGCEGLVKTVIHLCDQHGSTDVVTFAKVLKQALGDTDEETIKALLVALAPAEPAPKGVKVHELLAELSLARSNSHSMGGLKS